jgi:hypothetical protein
VIGARQQEFLQIKCPPVLLVYLEIVHCLCEKRSGAGESDDSITQRNFSIMVNHCRNTLKSQLSTLPYRKKFDICYGELRKQIIEFALSKSTNLPKGAAVWRKSVKSLALQS